MEIDSTMRVIILVGLLIGLTLLIYYELRYMRRRRKPKIDMQLIKDEAFNSISTAKAVANVLSKQKRDTSKAEQLIFQAENAYSRGEYVNSKQLAEDAKRELERSKEIEEEAENGVCGTMISERTEEDKEEKDMDNKTLFEEEKKLPENYLQSKFMIKNVERDLERAASAGTSTGEAMELLQKASSNFDDGRYTEALKLACRADRCLKHTDAQFIDGSRQSKKDDRISTAPVDEESPIDSNEDLTRAPTREAVGMTCLECGAIIDEDDAFCGRCGFKIVRERRCSSCGVLANQDDSFCRKCGTKLT